MAAEQPIPATENGSANPPSAPCGSEQVLDTTLASAAVALPTTTTLRVDPAAIATESVAITIATDSATVNARLAVT